MLSPDAVFIDLIRYSGSLVEKHRTRYAAFLLTRDKPVRRVELGDAPNIDETVAAWRRAIAAGAGVDAGHPAAKLIWQPLAAELPEKTALIYVSADGELAKVPWVALPDGNDGRIVLDRIAVAAVPHGPYLLEQLRLERKSTKEVGDVIAVGRVAYSAQPAKEGRWPHLDGTAAEIRALHERAQNRRVDRLEGIQASASAVLIALQHARYAHIATHGYFDEDSLSTELKLARGRALARPHLAEPRQEDRLLSARSPLAYTGLVFAGANDPDEFALPGAIACGASYSVLAPPAVLTGESIVGLPLEGLRLCVLSACETGLGAVTGGEGVHGLQRAFHLAGCSNVVGSLWNVNDEATAALMNRFYHYLWEKNEPPVQALRLAQIDLYRNPSQVKDMVRGNAPKFSSGTKPLPKSAEARESSGAPVKLWAAFLLSGPGR